MARAKQENRSGNRTSKAPALTPEQADELRRIARMSDKELDTEIVVCQASLPESEQRAVMTHIRGDTLEQVAVAAELKGKTHKQLASSAKRLLGKPGPLRYKWLVQAKLRRKDLCTANNIQERLWIVVRRCMQEIEPIYQGSGADREFTGEFKFDAANAIKAMAELNKMQGNYKPLQLEAKGKLGNLLESLDGTTTGIPG